MKLIKIDPIQFGLSEIQATAIANKFLPVLEEMQPHLDKYAEIKNLDPADPANSGKFKELRLKLVKCRTNAAKIHKEEKAFYLAGGKYVDTWKNKQLEITEPIETDLSEKEKYAEIQEIKRKELLRAERAEQLRKWECDEANSITLGDMSESVFNILLSGAEKAYNDKIEAEKQAEILRLAKVKYDEEIQQEEVIWALYYQRIADSEEAEERAKLAEQKRIKDEAEAKAKSEFEASEKIRLADEKAKAEIQKAKDDAEKAIKAAADKAEADMKETERQAELKAENERKAEAEKQRLAALAPDKDKLTKYANELRNVTIPVLTQPESKEKLNRFFVKMKIAMVELE